MLKRSLPIFIFSAFVVVACSENEQVNQIEDTQLSAKTEDEVAVVVVPDKVVDLDIEGMVCQMGCGGSIRKELKATGAVDKVEFDFSEERKTNFAKVYFDSKKITEDEIVKLVSEINNGQFKVSAKESGSIEVNQEGESESSGSGDVKVNSYEPSFEMPNLFDLISELLQ